MNDREKHLALQRPLNVFLNVLQRPVESAAVKSNWHVGPLPTVLIENPSKQTQNLRLQLDVSQYTSDCRATPDDLELKTS